ncbi:hypothetical protein NQ317_013878 [Molorchus minor]|uniref:BTB domain-containing protein n=1 Tax=Molorchus minor TaxID=1323400 RepID=A0ABQ9K786_9CUCU|nr:hypothetical protein NQ317_013878 [Molorchus minor]
MNEKNVLLCLNGIDTNGVDLLKFAGIKLKITAKKLFLETGTEITSTACIRNMDKLYVSDGSDFIKTLYNKGDGRHSEWVTLNVGGKCFTTSKRTLTASEPSSMLARMFSEDNDGYLFTPSSIDKNGAYLIDRSPTYFEPILNYLRCGQLVYDHNVNPEGILEEARFFE